MEIHLLYRRNMELLSLQYSNTYICERKQGYGYMFVRKKKKNFIYIFTSLECKNYLILQRTRSTLADMKTISELIS